MSVMPKKHEEEAFRNFPKTAYVLSLGGHCNNRCATCVCANRAGQCRSAREILDQASRVKDHFHGFILADGEPTLMDDLPGLLRELAQLEPEVLQVHTNGRMFSHSPYLEQLARVPGVDYVVKVFGGSAPAHDAMTRAPGSFKQTIRGLKNFAEARTAGMGFHVECRLTKESIPDFANLIRIVSAFEPDSILITGGYPAGGGAWADEKQVKALFRELDRDAGRHALFSHYAFEHEFINEYQPMRLSKRSGRHFLGADTNNPFVFRHGSGHPPESLLAYAPYDTDRARPFSALPLSIGAFQAFLNLLGYPCTLVDMEQECQARDIDFTRELKGCWFVEQAGESMDADRARALISDILPPGKVQGHRLAALSLVEHFQARFAVHIAEHIKSVSPETTLAVGCLRPEEFASYESIADCTGSVPMFGEYCLAGLLNKMEYGDRTGVAIYGNDVSGLSRNGPVMNMPCELKRIPRPDFSGLPHHRYNEPPGPPLCGFLDKNHPEKRNGQRVGLVMYDITKGCNFKCVFCNYQGTFLLRDPVRAARDMLAIAQATGLRGFHMLDTSINNSPSHLEAFCRELVNIGSPVLWSSSARPSFKNRELVELVRASGCVLLTFGLESGSDDMLRDMRKGFTADTAARSLALTAEAGIVNQVNLMSGFLNETTGDLDATLDFIQRNKSHIDLVSNHSSFVWYATMNISPEQVGITLRPGTLETPSGAARMYDEDDGRTWEQIREYKKQAYRAIEAAIADYRLINTQLREADIYHLYVLGMGRDACREYFSFLARRARESGLDANRFDNTNYDYRVEAFFG